MRWSRRHHVREQPARGALSRRTFLGGVGAALALPWLEAMAPRRALAAAEPAAPRRLLFYFVPNGIHMPAWRPTVEGPGYDLPPILAPLAPVQAKVSVLTGLANRPAIVPVAGDHARGTGSFLTCVTPEKADGDGIYNGRSVDQVAAAALGGATRFPSLQLATTNAINIGSCDSGYSCAYSRNVSWAGPSTPLPKISRPRLLFDRLFAGAAAGLSPEEIARNRRLQRSVLDWAREDAKRLQERLGATDRAKLEEYLASVRGVETLIEQAEAAPACEPPDRPPKDVDFPDQVRLMHELMALAFQCDMTRVMSFMLGDGGSNRSFDFLGVTGAHHAISHHQKDPENLAKLQIIGTWEVEQLAGLLQRLDAIEEPGGTALDHSLVYFSSEISDGDRHNHDDLPVLLAGRAGGRVAAGRHVVYPEQDPVADLFIAMLRAVDVEVETFGDDGTRPLPGLLAEG